MDSHERLAALRGRLEILQQALADEIGMSRVSLSQLETGRIRKQDYGTVEAIARAFRLDIEDLAAYWIKGEIDIEEVIRRRTAAQRRAAAARRQFSNLEIAIAYLREVLSEEAIDAVRKAAETEPTDRSPMTWGQELAKAQAAVVLARATP